MVALGAPLVRHNQLGRRNAASLKSALPLTACQCCCVSRWSSFQPLLLLGALYLKSCCWEHCPVINTPYSFASRRTPHNSVFLSRVSEASFSMEPGLLMHREPLGGVGSRAQSWGHELQPAVPRCTALPPRRLEAGGEAAPTWPCCLPSCTACCSTHLPPTACFAPPSPPSADPSPTKRGLQTPHPSRSLSKSHPVPKGTEHRRNPVSLSLSSNHSCQNHGDDCPHFSAVRCSPAGTAWQRCDIKTCPCPFPRTRALGVSTSQELFHL